MHRYCRIMLVFIGVLIAGPVGLVLGLVVAYVMAKRAHGTSSAAPERSEQLEECDITGNIERHETGEVVRLGFGADVPLGCDAYIYLENSCGERVEAIPQFAHPDGTFFRAGPIVDGEWTGFIPTTALKTGPGTYRLVVTVMQRTEEGPRALRRAVTPLTLAFKGPWDKAAFYLPLICLLTYVGLAEGRLTPASVSVIRRACETQCGLGPHDTAGLHQAMRAARRKMSGCTAAELRHEAEMVAWRLGRLNTQVIALCAIEVARADGPVTEAELEAVHLVATACGMDAESWARFLEAEGLDHGRYYAVLGLKRGASASEVRDAYRRLIRENHPDRFAREPEAVQEGARKRSIELREAYEALRDLLGEREAA